MSQLPSQYPLSGSVPPLDTRTGQARDFDGRLESLVIDRPELLEVEIATIRQTNFLRGMKYTTVLYSVQPILY